jgi:hypothetical protein
MGKTRINNREITTPSEELTVRELKELADIPEHEKLYDVRDGQVLEDDQRVRPDHREFGSTPDWERG